MSRLFMPSATAEAITITRGELKLSLTPGEVGKATNLIRIALGMEELNGLPSHIKDTPFVIRFFEDGVAMALERTEGLGSVPFEWRESDQLILAIKDGLALAINERTLIKGPRGRGPSRLNHDPFI